MQDLQSPIVRQETAGQMFGVNGRFFAVTIGGDNYKPGTFTSQRFSASREYDDNGTKYCLKVTVRFDDDCRNGHNSFAITGSGHEYARNAWRETFGGCCHEEIARVFPELAPLIQWHLCGSNGPMHYVANTVYHANNRDHNGKLAGEPWAWSKAIQFGENPIKHKVKDKFWQFLKDAAPHNGRAAFDFEVLEISERKKDTGPKQEYYRKFTFGGYGAAWHDCPFDTEQQALDFLKALQTCAPQFLAVPTLFSDGKARELDHARSSAVWPEATDAELSVSKEELTAALKARQPALVARFRAAVESAGLLWAPEL